MFKKISPHFWQAFWNLLCGAIIQNWNWIAAGLSAVALTLYARMRGVSGFLETAMVFIGVFAAVFFLSYIGQRIANRRRRVIEEIQVEPKDLPKMPPFPGELPQSPKTEGVDAGPPATVHMHDVEDLTSMNNKYYGDKGQSALKVTSGKNLKFIGDTFTPKPEENENNK
jgi:hypothetical protein